VSRRHGRNAQVYVGVTNGAAASPCTFQSAWSIAMAVDDVDVTAFGDSNKVYVAGLPDASGDFSGFWDDVTSQTYIAATDGLPRNFYLYADATNDVNVYFFGTAIMDYAIDTSVSGAVTVKASWKAASKIQRYTAWGGLGT